MSEDSKERKTDPYIGLGLTFGAGIGLVIGAQFGQVGIGLTLGASVGLLISIVLMALSKRK